MSVNDYIEIAQKATGTVPDKAPSADHTAQLGVGLDYAKRQAERPAQEAPQIPPLGATPLAN